MQKLSFLAIPFLALALVGCGGDGGEGPVAERGAESVPQTHGPADFVNEYVCTDERAEAEKAVVGSSYSLDMLAQWDGTPFAVDVSDSFTNAEVLLDAIDREATKIRNALGYEVFVAGDVIPLQDVQGLFTCSTWDESDLQHCGLPSDNRIQVQCCVNVGGTAGRAFAWWRVILLSPDSFQSRHVLIHELYHMAGFTHPDMNHGVPMSTSLMYGTMGRSRPTASTRDDLAKLACILD